MEKMIGIAFTSSMTPGLTRAGRAELVANARISNGKADISSVLLFCDGSFMQYMEGPESRIEATYVGIKNDKRHRGIIKLFQHDIAEREFGNSKMSYHESSDASGSSSEVAAWLEPTKTTSNAGRTVLSGFWCNNNALRTKH